MQDEQKPTPGLTAAARAAQAKRDLRRAEALRANLRRRKAQERGREPDPPGGGPQIAPEADVPLQDIPAHKLFQDISE